MCSWRLKFTNIFSLPHQDLHLFERQSDTQEGKEKVTELSSILWYIPQTAILKRWAKLNPGNPSRSPACEIGVLNTWATSTAFPGTRVRSCSINEREELTSVLIRSSSCPKWWLNPLHHRLSPRTLDVQLFLTDCKPGAVTNTVHFSVDHWPDFYPRASSSTLCTITANFTVEGPAQCLN